MGEGGQGGRKKLRERQPQTTNSKTKAQHTQDAHTFAKAGDDEVALEERNNVTHELAQAGSGYNIV